MVRKTLFWLLWLGFIVYLLLFAPPINGEATLTLIKNLLTLQLTEINPIVSSLFALIGVCIYLYSSVLFFDGRMQKIPFYPFAIASLGTGVIGLIPYLALREPNREFIGDKDLFLELLESRLVSLFVALFTIGLLSYAIIAGDGRDFIVQFQTDRFIHGMTLAFCLFCLLFPTVLGDDIARRGDRDRWFWFVPLLGSFACLSSRSPLKKAILQH